jgi:hypothetical protein
VSGTVVPAIRLLGVAGAGIGDPDLRMDRSTLSPEDAPDVPKPPLLCSPLVTAPPSMVHGEVIEQA